MKHFLTILLFAFCSTLSAEPAGWITRDGKPAPSSDAMKSIEGFGGWLIVTSDLDWQSKWNASPETIPHFRGASDVEYGQQLAILTFFGNPKTDESGEIQITCDIKVTRPDKSISADAAGVECASGKLQGDSRNVRLTDVVINFVGEEGDPPGVWIIDVRLTDHNRKVELPLRAQFTLRAKSSVKPMHQTPEDADLSNTGSGAASQ